MKGQTSTAQLLVTGSVAWEDSQAIDSVLAEFAERFKGQRRTLRIITGTASGADEIARQWAARHGIEVFAHDLDKGAYPTPMHRYNEEMLQLRPDVVLAFKQHFDENWHSENCAAGTEHMCRIAVRAGVPVFLNGNQELGLKDARSSSDSQD